VTFSVVDAVVQRSLPFEESERLVMVGREQRDVVSHIQFDAWRREADSFDASCRPIGAMPSNAISAMKPRGVGSRLADAMRGWPPTCSVWARPFDGIDGRASEVSLDTALALETIGPRQPRPA
jgi:hypothetical protein